MKVNVKHHDLALTTATSRAMVPAPTSDIKCFTLSGKAFSNGYSFSKASGTKSLPISSGGDTGASGVFDDLAFPTFACTVVARTAPPIPPASNPTALTFLSSFWLISQDTDAPAAAPSKAAEESTEAAATEACGIMAPAFFWLLR